MIPPHTTSERTKGGQFVSTTAINVWKELASRRTDGLAVALLWSETTDRVRVTVADDRFDEEFDLDVASAHALDAFYHPFAYAAGRGLGFGSAMRASFVPERSAA